jgi:hypothetical protein
MFGMKAIFFIGGTVLLVNLVVLVCRWVATTSGEIPVHVFWSILGASIGVYLYGAYLLGQAR